MNDFILRARSLSKKYGRVEALREATFSLSRNKITAFLGENGAGKTTTLKVILGFLRPDSGAVEIGEGRVAYVPEHPVFFNWLRGNDIIVLTAQRYGIEKQNLARRIDDLSEKISFDRRLLERKILTYSLGNQKKFSYLQSLLISPDLLIVDEPFTALDPPSIKSVRDLFSELKREGKTVFLSSHLVSEVEKICDEFIIIHQGYILIQQNLRWIKETYLLVRLEKNEVEGDKLKFFSSYLREKNLFLEMLVEKSRLQELEKFLGRSISLDTKAQLDLEKIFFFFAGGTLKASFR
jgi:ABC-2 type transport system ATP-binding protein